jgi:hypothetical protein
MENLLVKTELVSMVETPSTTTSHRSLPSRPIQQGIIYFLKFQLISEVYVIHLYSFTFHSMIL